jgi:hypothetical protein
MRTLWILAASLLICNGGSAKEGWALLAYTSRGFQAKEMWEGRERDGGSHNKSSTSCSVKEEEEEK